MIWKSFKKGLKFGNSLSEQTVPKVCQKSLPTVLRNRHVVRGLILARNFLGSSYSLFRNSLQILICGNFKLHSTLWKWWKYRKMKNEPNELTPRVTLLQGGARLRCTTTARASLGSERWAGSYGYCLGGHKDAPRIWALRKDQSKQRYYKLEVLIGARVRCGCGSTEKYAEEKHHVRK